MTKRTIAALAAAAALVGCAGAGIDPFGISARPAAARVAMANPCAISNFYVFHGACVEGRVAASGGSFHLPTYRGLSLTLTFPQNDGGGKPVMLLGDATGRGDITGTYRGKPFPHYPKPCASTCPGTAFVYLVRQAFTAFVATGPNALTIENAGTFPGHTCFGIGLGPRGWQVSPHGSASPKGHHLTLAYAPRVNHVSVALAVGGIACK